MKRLTTIAMLAFCAPTLAVAQQLCTPECTIEDYRAVVPELCKAALYANRMQWDSFCSFVNPQIAATQAVHAATGKSAPKPEDATAAQLPSLQ